MVGLSSVKHTTLAKDIMDERECVMHFTVQSSIRLSKVSCCTGCDLHPPHAPMTHEPHTQPRRIPSTYLRPIQDVPGLGTKARWDPQGTPKRGWEWRYESYGASVRRLWRVRPLVLRFRSTRYLTGFIGQRVTAVALARATRSNPKRIQAALRIEANSN